MAVLGVYLPDQLLDRQGIDEQRNCVRITEAGLVLEERHAFDLRLALDKHWSRGSMHAGVRYDVEVTSCGEAVQLRDLRKGWTGSHLSWRGLCPVRIIDRGRYLHGPPIAGIGVDVSRCPEGGLTGKRREGLPSEP
ncbi:MAG: hypothetical protein EWM73_01200 [Nitrospira sp.]|nr:MAG: hypothetical protein EWM73_01200 [Nitrospira sp.]